MAVAGTIASVIGLGLTALISYFSFDLSLFSWHPILMSLSCLVLTLRAIVEVYGRKTLTAGNSRVRASQLHFVLNCLSLLLVTVAFLVIYQNKENQGKKHFTTYHSWSGCLTYFLFAGASLGGLVNTFNRNKGKVVARWQWKDASHRLSGHLTFASSVLTMCLALYAGWGFYRLGDYLNYLSLFLLAVVQILVLIETQL